MERPRASSTGATASQLEAFLLSRGGLPSGLAQELRLLGNPGTTLPVPVPSGMSAQQLKIGGGPGAPRAATPPPAPPAARGGEGGEVRVGRRAARRRLTASVLPPRS